MYLWNDGNRVYFFSMCKNDKENARIVKVMGW